MVTTFCHYNQAKMKASDAVSSLCQCNSLELSVVVARRYTNTLYIPWRTSHFLHIDVSILSRGASSAQFPLNQLCLCRLLPFSETEVVLPHEEGVAGLKVFSHSLKILWQSSEEEHHLPDLVWLSVPSFALLPCQEEGAKTEKESGYHPALQ